MAKIAAKREKARVCWPLLVSIAVFAATMLAAPSIEASRYLPSTLTAAQEPEQAAFDRVDDFEIEDESFALFTDEDFFLLAAVSDLEEPERAQVLADLRFRLFPSSAPLPHRLEPIADWRPASGDFLYCFECNLWENRGLTLELWWTSDLYAFVGWGPHMGRDPMGECLSCIPSVIGALLKGKELAPQAVQMVGDAIANRGTFTLGVAKSVGSMALGIGDFAEGGKFSGTLAAGDAFLSTEGGIVGRSTAALDAYGDQRRRVSTLGLSDIRSSGGLVNWADKMFGSADLKEGSQKFGLGLEGNDLAEMVEGGGQAIVGATTIFSNIVGSYLGVRSLAAKRGFRLFGGSKPSRGASFGMADSSNYRRTFLEVNPALDGEVVVHHAVEQQTLTRFPDTVTASEIHSYENLRGVPKALNSEIHLSKIRKVWNQFYRSNSAPTKEQLLEKAAEIDLKYGEFFKPSVQK